MFLAGLFVGMAVGVFAMSFIAVKEINKWKNLCEEIQEGRKKTLKLNDDLIANQKKLIEGFDIVLTETVNAVNQKWIDATEGRTHKIKKETLKN